MNKKHARSAMIRLAEVIGSPAAPDQVATKVLDAAIHAFSEAGVDLADFDVCPYCADELRVDGCAHCLSTLLAEAEDFAYREADYYLPREVPGIVARKLGLEMPLADDYAAACSRGVARRAMDAAKETL